MTYRSLRILGPLAALALLLAYLGQRAHEPSTVLTRTQLMMDTFVTVSLWGVGVEEAEGHFRAAFDAVREVDRQMARAIDTPLVALNEKGSGATTPEIVEVVARGLAWAERSGGAFDPTLAALINLWRVTDGPHPPPSPEEIEEALKRTGHERVSVDTAKQTIRLDDVELDLGGIGKGYAIDRAAEALRSRGVKDFIVNGGGDLALAGSKSGDPWRVGVKHPREDGFLRVVAPAEGALVTSGDYERGYEWEGELIHHVLDPATGRPARDVRSVTVWGPNATDVDAVATSLFVMGVERGIAFVESLEGFEALVIDGSGVERESAGFNEKVKTVGEGD